MLGKGLGAGAAILMVLVVVVAAILGTVAAFEHVATPNTAAGAGSTPSPAARADIPPQLLALYQHAAGDCPGLDWSTLAGIGKVETDHGRATLPGVHEGENFAGAAGLMQFLEPTFAAVTSRHRLPPGGANPPSRYNDSDAIHTAAFYLCDSGAPRDLHAAIFTYNHSQDYVAQVLACAARYRLAPPTGSGDCHTITAPNPAAAQAISYACSQLGQPYVWGGTGPETSGGWDCSGLVQAAYARAGITLPRTSEEQVGVGPRILYEQLEPGDLIFYRSGGDVHHVGLYLGAGKMIHAPDFGKPVQIGEVKYPGNDFYTGTRPTERVSTTDSRART
ncbi:C40 family peptidase [Nocardia macrotermitis]|uniref:NlpC/P60 domain-containing protein n=1 Tax=Nocardia macrotermitis TaxID=2585198 RepID=A0A7K0DBW5_9NOCA|nr:C40 family peptidase [Nocardia macrotermitis]MQY23021.1 hypothetical protein [Nocardia macrotermitis]